LIELMNKNLKLLAETIAKANDLYFESNPMIKTTMGIMDKVLRQQGMNADAVTIECTSLDKKIVFLIHDDKPAMVNIALGNKAGSIYSSLEQELSDITVKTITQLLQQELS